MHEFALADAVIRTALGHAAQEGFSEITAIEVRVGELQRIGLESFEFALREVIPATEPRLARAEIRLEIEPARFLCRPCGLDFSVADSSAACSADELEAMHFIPELAHSFLRCPRCGSPDFEVARGRGVTIGRLEGR